MTETTYQSSNLAKHQTGNPVVRYLIDRYFDQLRGLVEPLDPQRVLDVGCGEGNTAERLNDWLSGRDYFGVDLNPEAAAYAGRRLPHLRFAAGSVYDLQADMADLVVCLEVIEHLDDPQRAIAALHRATTSDVVIGVPWEPWFRLGSLARGKYLATWGNHPEHIQAFNPRTIAELASSHFEVLKVTTSFPWVFVHGRRK